jgi:hypothetical protein
VETPIPSLGDFQECCRREFSYLLDNGFVEIPPPSAKFANPFTVAFAREGTKVLIVGEGYGTVASTTVRLPNGKELGPAQLVPGFVTGKKTQRARTKLSQLEQIRRDAERLHMYGAGLWSRPRT